MIYGLKQNKKRLIIFIIQFSLNCFRLAACKRSVKKVNSSPGIGCFFAFVTAFSQIFCIHHSMSNEIIEDAKTSDTTWIQTREILSTISFKQFSLLCTDENRIFRSQLTHAFFNTFRNKSKICVVLYVSYVNYFKKPLQARV